MLNVLEKGFVESRSEVQKLTEEKNEAMELKGTMSARISELNMLNSQQDECLAALEAEMKQLKEGHEAKIDKLRREVVEVKVEFKLEKVKKEDAIAQKDHLDKLVGNFWSLKDDCFCVATRCCEELERSFSMVGARPRRKNFIDDDIVGVMRWIYG
jgi:DNA repair ATPase RecN